MRAILLLPALLIAPAFAGPTAPPIQEPLPEGSVLGFPEFETLDGKALSDGRFKQWAEGEILHVDAIYTFRDGRSVLETARLRQKPSLEQVSWEWKETWGGEVLRRFEVDFVGKTAKAMKHEPGSKADTWEEKLGDLVPGRTFAGIGFSFALKALREPLSQGKKEQLKAVAFTPKPRLVDLTVSRKATETLEVAGEKVRADHIVLHPDIPAIAKLFVKAPDLHLWLLATKPYSVLRFEGPLQEPGDQVVRLEIYPGKKAG